MVPLIVYGGFLVWYATRKNPALAAEVKQIFGPFLPAGAKNMDQDILARTIWGEARGQGYAGMQAVANVIMNRVRTVQKFPAYAKRWGKGVSGVCKHPYQFSAWNVNDPNRAKMLAVTTADANFRTALAIAEKAIAGTLPDLTGGATYYHTTAIRPDWVKSSGNPKPLIVVGSHAFYTTGQIA